MNVQEYRRRDYLQHHLDYDDILVDELDIRMAAREGSIGRSLNFLPPRDLQPNLRPRMQPFNQAYIRSSDINNNNRAGDFGGDSEDNNEPVENENPRDFG